MAVGLLLLMHMVMPTFAVDHYVSLAGTNNPPYTNWADAATNIQWAVDAATNEDVVLVSNGTYYLSNQISITAAITMASVNGRELTIINGNYPNVTNRCLYMSNSPFVGGFTITNGYAATNDISGCGGGLYVSSGTISNCLITGNTSTKYGGGIFFSGGGTASTCTVKGNVAAQRGGGIYSVVDSAVYFLMSCCSIIANSVTNSNNGGGGLYCRGRILDSIIASNILISSGATYGGGVLFIAGYMSNCVISWNVATNAAQCGGVALGGGSLADAPTIYNSLISNNTSYGHAGGVFMYSGCSNSGVNCVIANNTAGNGAGGIWMDSSGKIRQCLIRNNSAKAYGGGVVVYDIKNNNGSVDSCTIVGNTATNTGGGIVTRNTNNNYSVSNCVVWGNTTNGSYVSDIGDYSNSTNSFFAFSYTCANYTNFPAGRGNITNDPQFVDSTFGNYRLNANSPCVNAGSNQNWMTNAVDFDGRQRVRYGTVDMGAYETIYQGSIYRIP